MFDRENENYVYELVSKNIKKIRKKAKEKDLSRALIYLHL